MATLTPSTLARLEDMLRPPRRGGSLGRGRKSQAIRGQDFELKLGGGKGDAAARSAKALATFERIASKAPEVVVKRTGKQSSGSHALANFTYIARLGWGQDKELELVTNKGQTLTTAEQMQALAKRWEAWHEEDKARRKGPVSYSIVFSMPKGTDAQALKEAALEVARRECPDQGWVLALHNDRDHVHAHLTVQARDQHGERQFFPRARMVEMREAFAEQLRERGIEANATSRRARGKTERDVPAAVVRESDRAARAKEGHVHSARVKGLQDRVASHVSHGVVLDQVDMAMRSSRDKVVEIYSDVARELIASPDRKDRDIAMAIGRHVADMPSPRSRFAEIRDMLQRSFTRDRSPIQDLPAGAFGKTSQTGAAGAEKSPDDLQKVYDRIKGSEAQRADRERQERSSEISERMRHVSGRINEIDRERQKPRERDRDRDGPER